MATLMAKALSRMAIGTHIELSYLKNTAELENVSGIITDSDFSESFEIQLENTETITLGFDVVKSCSVKKKITDILRDLPEGTLIQYSHGAVNKHEPNKKGTIIENDHEQSVLIRLDNGEEECIDYSIIQSLLVINLQVSQQPDSFSTDQPKIESCNKNVESFQLPPPEIYFSYPDSAIKQAFDTVPTAEKAKLSPAYESFKNASRTNNKILIQQSVAKLRTILEEMPECSGNAARFCACVIRRADEYDHNLFLIGSYFDEAAICCYREKMYTLAGAYSILALLKGIPERKDDLFSILMYSIMKADDITGFRYLCDSQDGKYESEIDDLIKIAFRLKNEKEFENLSRDDALERLSTLYAQDEMLHVIENWLHCDNSEVSHVEVQKPDVQAVLPIEAVSPIEIEKQEINIPKVIDTGMITSLFAETRTGKIKTDYDTFNFSYDDITDAVLKRAIEGCTLAKPSGKGYLVKYQVSQSDAKEIVLNSDYIDLERAVSADNFRADASELAFEICLYAFEKGEFQGAVFDIVKLAFRLFNSKQNISYIEKAIECYEKYQAYYPKDDPFAMMDAAKCYCMAKKYEQMVELGKKALDIRGNNAKQRISLLANFLGMLKTYYEIVKQKSLLESLLDYIDNVKTEYSKNFTYDTTVLSLYNSLLLPLKIFAECELEMVEEALQDFSKLPDTSPQRLDLGEMISHLQEKLLPLPAPEEEQPEYFDISTEEDNEEDVLPYADNDGWDALGVSKTDVIEYALNIQGEERVAAILAYLRAGALLNQQIMPVYRIVALAADDPMEPHEYNLDVIVEEMGKWDNTYSSLNDYCIAAVILRTAFSYGRKNDYSLGAYWQSIGILDEIPSLNEAYEVMEKFRENTGCPIGVYSALQSGGADRLQKEINDNISHAEHTYIKHVWSPYSNNYFPLVKTKEKIFSQESFLVRMLVLVKQNARDDLHKLKKDFIKQFLKPTENVSSELINKDAIDALIDQTFSRAVSEIHNTKRNQHGQQLVGSRRGYLYNAIAEVLYTICVWYELDEQQEEILLITEENNRVFSELLPVLCEKLRGVSDNANQLMSCKGSPQRMTGLYLLSFAVLSLEAKLKGQSQSTQRKFIYKDFLRTNYILLDENFLPDLSSTFCALPEFNILNRIRQHIEAPKSSFQEQIDKIYGTDKTLNNYGTAKRIIEYLEAIGETIVLPNHADEYISQTEQQIDMRYREFREEYALAMSYGRIMRTDDFCYNLLDTINYWFRMCKNKKDFGFFVSLVQHAENRIHNSAQNYQEKLERELDTIIENNPGYFSEHADIVESIKTDIVNQRFTVVEDSMTRLRLDDFSFTIERPEALNYLFEFLDSYAAIYRRVQDTSRPLAAIAAINYARNKDEKGGQRLIENWLSNGLKAAGAGKIAQILALLGWRNISVTAKDPIDRIELYECKRENAANRLIVTQHPIAAFGSDIYNSDDGHIHVACLYGNYDCDRICAKIRILERIRGNKIILLDCALGQEDRRALARELKRSENGFGYVYLVIDRVLLTYLATHYREDQVNCMLIAMGMPFSYSQPYVVDSAKTMPPEIFIGRKTELQNIKAEKEGVNLIYGGRQLGKTALLRKAQSDVDGHESQRAVLVDFKGKNCAQAARNLSEKLIDLTITPDAEVTEDWDELCRNISKRLRVTGETRISYLLLLLDEADEFINNCAQFDYSPLVALKDVQTSFPGRFKYVLAGLHDVVRFNRNVALGNNSVILHMSSMKITPFNTPEAEELLLKPLGYLGFSLPEKAIVSLILSTCNYFPGLIQLYAANLIRSVRAADYAGYKEIDVPPYVVTETQLRKVLSKKEFMDEIRNKYEATLLLDDNYYALALMLAYLYVTEQEKLSIGFTAKDVHNVILDLQLRKLEHLDEETIEALFIELRDLNVLRNVTGNSYLFASKNFSDLLGTPDDVFNKLVERG